MPFSTGQLALIQKQKKRLRRYGGQKKQQITTEKHMLPTPPHLHEPRAIQDIIQKQYSSGDPIQEYINVEEGSSSIHAGLKRPSTAKNSTKPPKRNKISSKLLAWAFDRIANHRWDCNMRCLRDGSARLGQYRGGWIFFCLRSHSAQDFLTSCESGEAHRQVKPRKTVGYKPARSQPTRATMATKIPL